jgi:Beta-1,3-glucanase
MERGRSSPAPSSKKDMGTHAPLAVVLAGTLLAFAGPFSGCKTPDVTPNWAPGRGGSQAGAGGRGGEIAALGGSGMTGGGAPTGVDPDGTNIPGGQSVPGLGGGSAATDAAVPVEDAATAACTCSAQEICIDGQCRARGTVVEPPFAACTNPPCINVLNNCPIPLWTHAVGTVPIDDGNVRPLGPGESFQYTGLREFGGGRLYAYYKEPEIKQDRTRLVSDFNQFVEMTVDRDHAGRFAQNYNISYVDYLSLPVLMKGSSPSCAPTHCGFRFQDWTQALKACPTELRYQHGAIATCMASYNYCLTPDPSGTGSYDTTREYCRKMQQAHGLSGSAIYGGTFPDRPATDVAFWDQVAAWNRGTVAGDADDNNYYKKEPFNHYAGWVHNQLGCARVYAFSTDDHQDKAGFVRCTADELNVVWCPNQ